MSHTAEMMKLPSEHICPCCGPRIDRRLDEIKSELCAVNSVLHRIMCQLDGLKTQGENLMAAIDDAIAKIDEASNKQAIALQAIADAEQETSNDLDDLIAKIGNVVPPETIAKLQASADRAQAASDALDAQAAFSKSLASKWTPGANPVPVPPPVFTAPPKK